MMTCRRDRADRATLAIGPTAGFNTRGGPNRRIRPLGADYERRTHHRTVIQAQACGISIYRMLLPVILLAVVGLIASFIINFLRYSPLPVSIITVGAAALIAALGLLVGEGISLAVNLILFKYINICYIR